MPGFDRKRIVGQTDEELEEFVCGICFDIFEDPVVTLCCRQTYCKDCITEWLSTNAYCPNDRQVLRKEELICVPRAMTNLLAKFTVRCDYHSNGCKAIVKMSDLEEHTIKCPFKVSSLEVMVCQKCNFQSVVEESHNCIQYLVQNNQKIIEENTKIKNENLELKRFLHEKTIVCNYQTMSAVLESARLHINDHVFEYREGRIDDELAQTFVEHCKLAVVRYNRFNEIANYIYDEINTLDVAESGLKWHVIAFSVSGGESMTSGINYFRVRFENVVIEIFSTPNLLGLI